MNKNDLIEKVAQECDCSTTSAARLVDCVFGAIRESLQKKEEVRLIGFGTFSVYRRAETKARNPQTKAEILIPASNQPKFKPGKALKEAVN